MILVIFRTLFTCTVPLEKPLEGVLYKYQLLLLLLLRCDIETLIFGKGISYNNIQSAYINK